MEGIIGDVLGVWGRGSVSSAKGVSMGWAAHPTWPRLPWLVDPAVEECGTVARGAVVWSLGIHWTPKGGDGSWKPDQRLGGLSKRTELFGCWSLDVLRCCVALIMDGKQQVLKLRRCAQRLDEQRATGNGASSRVLLCVLCCLQSTSRPRPFLSAFARCARSAACLPQQTRDGCLLFEPNLVFRRA